MWWFNNQREFVVLGGHQEAFLLPWVIPKPLACSFINLKCYLTFDNISFPNIDLCSQFYWLFAGSGYYLYLTFIVKLT